MLLNFLCNKNRRNMHTHTCPPTISLLTQIQRIIVVLGCKDLSNQFITILFRISIQSYKVRTPSRTTHTINMRHINYSQGWITNFPKGDSHSQRVVDSEATHTWEMRFHPHTPQCTKIQQHNINHKATLASHSIYHH